VRNARTHAPFCVVLRKGDKRMNPVTKHDLSYVLTRDSSAKISSVKAVIMAIKLLKVEEKT
jgi:hypothetical protein